jgi:hypothetical protein
MAFSVSSPVLSQLARKKRSGDELFETSQQAGAMGVDALEAVERLAQEGAKEKRAQAAHDQGILESNTRMGEMMGERERRDREESRLTLQANRATADAYQQRAANAARLRMAEDAHARANAADDRAIADAKDKRARGRLADYVAGGLDKGLDDDVIAESVTLNLGVEVSPLEIRAMRDAITRQRADEDAARAFTQSRTTRNLRPPAPKSGTGGVDAEMAAARLRTANAQATIAEQRAKDAKGGGRETAQQKNRHQALSTASGIIDDAIANFEKYQQETIGPSSGMLEGWRDIPGVSSFANPESRTRMLGDFAALGAMLFPLIGRSDAPTDVEVRSLLRLGLQPNQPEHVTRDRLRRLKELIDGGTVGAADEAVPEASPDAGWVTVTDGTETLEIPRADLADAQADGFKEVR